MQIFIILIVVSIGLYGIKVMEKIDNFIYYNIKYASKENSKVFLIYKGDNQNLEIEKILLQYNVPYEIIYDLSLYKNQNNRRYGGILAISNDDFNNIMICTIAARYNEIDNAISICNDLENKKIYDKYNIKLVSINEIESEEFILSIKEKMKNDENE